MLWSDLGWGSQAYTWWVQFNVEWVLAQIKLNHRTTRGVPQLVALFSTVAL